ncbi:MAG: choice-of-anchor D domain-containing protein [Bryobacterales bacterium]|nr:choice-of-anchor D domain-containing protein [Bryobacterales bacterium]
MNNKSMLAFRVAGCVLALTAGLIGQAQAQAPNLVVRYVNADLAAPVSVQPGGSITVPGVAAGKTAELTATADNQGAVQWTLKSLTVSGAGFSISSVNEVVVPPGSTVPFSISFSASALGRYSGRLTVQLNSGNTPYVYVFYLSASVVAPDYVVSYTISPAGSETRLAPGAAIRFPDTETNQTSSALIVIRNGGAGTGTVQNVTVQSSTAFRVSGLPLLPARLAAGETLRFTVSFTPAAGGDVSGLLRMELDSERRDFPLEGKGLAAVWRYSYLVDGVATAITPGGRLSLPNTVVGETRSVEMRISNLGNKEGRITSVSVSGTAFRISDMPALPVTLPVNQELRFNLVFSPRDSGDATVQLRIDQAYFEVSATGVGARLTVNLESGGGLTPVAESGQITFSNTAVGSTSGVTLHVVNAGNATGVFRSLIVSGSAFSISGPPPLPASLAPGAEAVFQVVFKPNALGSLTGGLQVDDKSYSLRGAGAAPAAIPAVSFREAPGSSEALQQPYVGLELANAYEIELEGKLTLTFVPESFVDDPAIQFATGGRTVDFKIPANSRQAVFGQSGNRIQFQTGTVAGTITIAASFSVTSVNVTPTPAPACTVVVPAAPPRIRSVQVGTRTASGFELLITGYANTRELSRLQLTLAPAAGANLQTTTLTAEAEAAFSAWYQSTASRAYGSQYTASVLININGKVEDVASVTVTATNVAGPSNAATANLR